MALGVCDCALGRYGLCSEQGLGSIENTPTPPGQGSGIGAPDHRPIDGSSLMEGAGGPQLPVMPESELQTPGGSPCRENVSEPQKHHLHLSRGLPI